ncbi:MAG: succinyl-diaminopimelate desuccinylase [Alphaproteobacteria bacterium]|nr:MAG: succinyl-diaminopimelate desuccinylase [alpha proteobacterium MED-G09]
MKDIGTANPIELTKTLINCRSVTPENDGAIEQVSHWLEEIGFKSEILNFEEEGTASIKNLWSKMGSKGPTICFAGHTDVVPTGNIDEWSSDPFDANEVNDKIIGRGAADMKGSIASFISATNRFVKEYPDFPGSIGFIITGDEEGCAINGTKKILTWMKSNNISFDDCLVGEPTNPNSLGEMIKIGRRGSVNGVITVKGVQGHVAYPHLADNPIPKLIKILENLINQKLDDGTEHFQPSNIEITSIDIGNTATNVIPKEASANFNIRYNDIFDREKIEEEVHNRIRSLNYDYSIKFEHSGDSFLTSPGKLTKNLSKIIEDQTGNTPELSTSGGTSDARFIKDYGNVVEFGLIGATMHKVDESASIKDIKNLTEIYYQLLKKYFY